jgi:serine/threonine-protein kinase
MRANFELNPEQWSALRGLLDSALALAPEQRSTWIEQLPPEHASLKERLRGLLAHVADGTGASPLDTLPKIETAQFLAEHAADVTEKAGDRIGPYRLVRPLGSGGMGSVWLAERSDMLQKRPVALKLPHAAWRGARLAERLAREREILAALNHPNIARLYDAGIAAEGQPYLALEYVEGDRLDAYCARNQLDIPARLRLFLQVARAVAHAHSNLVVHRDLKPTNILVTEAGDVKLLDFGIAKLLEGGGTHETELTQTGGHALTPDYASPEQILGHPMATSADVYSLGVVLYELLTGTRPYKLKRDSRAALEEAIVHAEPAPPSKVVADAKRAKRLRGDLDTITLKALKKLPNERYPTVAALAEDIERHLALRPVLAQPDGRLYRLQKFVARNRLAVGAAATVIAATAAGAAVAVWQMFEARSQRDVAVYQQQRANATNEFLSLLLEEVGSTDKPPTLAQLLDRSTQMLEAQYGVDERFAANMLFEASRRYATIGKSDRELELLDRAIASARRLGDNDLLASAQCAAAMTLLRRDRAEATARLAEAQRLGGDQRAAPPAVRANCLRARSLAEEADGRIDVAITTLEQALAMFSAENVNSPALRLSILHELGHYYFKIDRTDRALALSEEALRLLDQSGRGGSMAKVVGLVNYAAILNRAGEVRSALGEQERAIALASRAEASGAPPVGFGLHIASSLLRLARSEEALEHAVADTARARSAGNNHYAALGDFLVARILVKLGRYAEAEARLAQAEQGFGVNSGGNQRMLNELTLTRCDMSLARGQPDAALEGLNQVLVRLGYPQRRDGAGLGSAQHMGARVHLARGDGAAAERAAAESETIAKRVARDPRKSADVGQAQYLRARALALKGESDAARKELPSAITALEYGFGAEHPETREARALLIQLETGRSAK